MDILEQVPCTEQLVGWELELVCSAELYIGAPPTLSPHCDRPTRLTTALFSPVSQPNSAAAFPCYVSNCPKCFPKKFLNLFDDRSLPTCVAAQGIQANKITTNTLKKRKGHLIFAFFFTLFLLNSPFSQYPSQHIVQTIHYYWIRYLPFLHKCLKKGAFLLNFTAMTAEISSPSQS